MAAKQSSGSASDPASGSASAGVATWRYVIPNAVTSLSLVFGLVVLVVASEGEFELAGWFTIWSVLLDKLDGTVARLLGASSKFGAQLDSLADLVVFGVAPAGTILLLMRARPQLYTGWLGDGALDQVSMHVMFGMLALFVVCAALRLAKFNVLDDEGGPPVFFGTASTFAGGVLALSLLIGLKHQLDWLLGLLPVFALVLALLMVSNLVIPKLGHDTGRAFKLFTAVNLALCYVFGFMRVFPEYMLAVALSFMGAGIVYGAIHREALLAGEAADGSELEST
ncbi:CDP-diacylglycerol--serine O-phosphatidyltransferase [Enhygromyxa salina]|uniref:CDP-diacylglycerol--serine O-phosphatidyltransferase n=1 Tax=Enhygromyxa salina TaxID=215803 RepID=A0A0C1ZE82_9BACT|nr:CDP-alcohol phosphatidyltransferase family protein [Enhygromyxa salina]KIG15984.1 CDP-diacylglycerol--serine O-phosphatidyltransferase [Enhygromyxa salina]